MCRSVGFGGQRVTGVTAPQRLAEVSILSNPTVRAAMDLCASSPGEWISIRDVEEKTGRTPYQARGDLAGLTMTVKRRFGRSNWPFRVQWAAGGDENAYYGMDPAVAAVWRDVTATSTETAEPPVGAG